MAIDIRADVTCSLGTVISGSLGDDYIQGNGLVKTKGEVEINGLITPSVGTAVTFAYTKNGVTQGIPRKLRVLSSFADPFRRTTKVELGCKLTYLEDLKETINWTSLDDPENNSYTKNDIKIVTIPIHASSVMNRCLQALGITASSNPLTSKFSVEVFDFSNGYVDVLSDLLISESFFGYLDENEVLQVVNLSQSQNLGPVYTHVDLIDIGQINSGSLPGESVIANYSTLKLRQPGSETNPDSEEVRRRRWEYNSTTAGPNYYYIGNRVWRGTEDTETSTIYKTINGKDLPVERTTTEYASSAKIGGSIATQYVQNGLPFYAQRIVTKQAIESLAYDAQGNLVESIIDTYEDKVAIFGSLDLKYVFSGGSVVFYYGLALAARTITTYDNAEESQQQITSEYKLWPFTIPGQQAVAAYRDYLNTPLSVSNFVAAIMDSGVVHARTTCSVNVTGFDYTPSRPKNLINSTFARDGNSSNGWKTESQTEISLALGSATAQRRVEFSVPYSPDDTFTGPPGGPYSSIPSDAAEKATRFARIQNQLLLGNRNGVSLQLTPEKIPSAPFSPVYLEANGLTAFYRTNGNQWAFSRSGIVCSTDALFWGAVGGTGDFWFPVAPGVTTLPETPPIVDGYINPTSVVSPYNETLICKSVAKVKLEVKSFPYSFTLAVIPLAISVKTKVSFSQAIVAEGGSVTAQFYNASFALQMRALPAQFSVTTQEVNFIPEELQADKGSYYINAYTAELTASMGVQPGIRLPRLGSNLPANIVGDTTGWVEHFTNNQWWNGSAYVTVNPDSAYLRFLPGDGYFKGIAETGNAPIKFPDDCFVANHPYMAFNYAPTDWTEAMSLTPLQPPFPKVFFGAELNPGAGIEKMIRRVIWKQHPLRPGYAYGPMALTIRYEGIREVSGVPGVPNVIAEVTFASQNRFYETGQYVIEVRMGVVDRPAGLLMVTDGNGAQSSAAIAQNNSWVFTRSANQSTWTVLPQHYLV